MDRETRDTAGPRGPVGSVLRGLDLVADWATAALFIVGAVAVFVMVVTRYGFAYSDPSVEILARFFMIWGTFIGVSSAVRFGSPKLLAPSPTSETSRPEFPRCLYRIATRAAAGAGCRCAAAVVVYEQADCIAVRRWGRAPPPS